MLVDGYGASYSEPNNFEWQDEGQLLELCGVANFSQATGGYARWSDVACNITAPTICRLQGRGWSVSWALQGHWCWRLVMLQLVSACF
jgi:hypothetical protein